MSEHDELHLVDAQIALLNEARMGCDINGIDRREIEAEIETWQSIRALIEHYDDAGRLVEAAREYIARMEEIYGDDRYRGVFTMAWAHGQEYSGPTDVEAREKLKTALKLFEDAQREAEKEGT